jgi:hypothetical protein
MEDNKIRNGTIVNGTQSFYHIRRMYFDTTDVDFRKNNFVQITVRNSESFLDACQMFMKMYASYEWPK